MGGQTTETCPNEINSTLCKSRNSCKSHHQKGTCWKNFGLLIYPPVSKASREVANLNERKNPHTHIYGVKEFVCLSITNFDPNNLGTGKRE